MEAIILAGGLGKRLMAMVKDIPKPMADIQGRPFLCYSIDHLLSHGIKNILLSVGYKHETIQRYFGSRYRDAEIQYVVEEKPLGTGGALRKALSVSRGKLVVVLNGDTFFAIDLKQMMEFHLGQKSTLTLAVKPMHDFSRYGTVQLKDHDIIGFREKAPVKFGYINGGIYVLNRSISELFDPARETFSFEVDFLIENLDNICPRAFISDEYFIDIGIPEDYAKAQRDFAKMFKNS